MNINILYLKDFVKTIKEVLKFIIYLTIAGITLNSISIKNQDFFFNGGILLDKFNSFKELQLKIGKYLFKYRSFSPTLVIFAVLLLSRPQSFFNGKYLIYLGFMTSFAGEFIRIITVGFTEKKSSGRGRVIKASALNTDGLYSFTRNPLYLGNLFITLGLTIIYNSFLCYLIVIGFWGFQYWYIILAEEDFLKKKFGQIFMDYLTKVPRLFPKFHKIFTLFSKDSSLRNIFPKDKKFNWRYILEREYNSFFSWLMCAIILKGYGDIHTKGFFSSRSEIIFLAVCLVFLMILFSLFKAWKKGLIKIFEK